MRLIEQGFFPTAPSQPNLAVSISFLEFYSCSSARATQGWSGCVHNYALQYKKHIIKGTPVLHQIIGWSNSKPSGAWTLYKWISSSELGRTPKKIGIFFLKAVLVVFWSDESIFLLKKISLTLTACVSSCYWTAYNQLRIND